MPFVGFSVSMDCFFRCGNLSGFEVYQQVGIWVSLWAQSHPLLPIATTNGCEKRSTKHYTSPGQLLPGSLLLLNP